MSKKKTMESKGTETTMELEQTEDILTEEREAMNAEDSGLEALTDEGTTAEARDAAPEAAQGETEGEVEVKNPREAELEEALQTAEAQREEYIALAQRVQADFENYRRRNQNFRKEAYEDGARAFVSSLLPVVDNIERAIDAAQESPDPALREGVEMMYRQLCEIFEKRGIRPIHRLGERFDPNLENAVLQGGAEDGEPGTVCEVLLKGYQMGDVVLRHAMVKAIPE